MPTQEEVAMTIDPYDATCPVCGVPPGELCVAVYENVGYEMPAPHILRFEAADRKEEVGHEG